MMKTVKIAKNPKIQLQMTEKQFELVELILASALNCFDYDKQGKKYYSNDNFVVMLTPQQHRTLQNLFKSK